MWVAQSKLVIEKKKKKGEKRYQIKLTKNSTEFRNREILARQKHVDTEKDLRQAVKRVCRYVCL